ncbi:MAG: ATP-binding cassette domain-containing protein [Candidatus Eremiobacterota bacterium]
MTSEKTVVTGKKLTKKYNDFTAVDSIDFEVLPGECFGFLGPNGAGKTSTMKMIYGFSPVTDGELTVLGLNVRFNIREIKGRLGVVPQEDNLDPDLNVLKNLLVYARYFDIPGKTAMETARENLELFQLWDRRHSRIRELSGGMKRRLVIARALINRPELLILDEPTTGLDPQARHLVWQKLRHLRRQGTTMILTTHYMDEATQLCDRLVVMDKGKILALASPQKLIDTYVKPEVLELHMNEEIKGDILKKLPENLQTEDIGDTLYIYCNDANSLRQTMFLKGVDRVLQRSATMEDVFLKLAGHTLNEGS